MLGCRQTIEHEGRHRRCLVGGRRGFAGGVVAHECRFVDEGALHVDRDVDPHRALATVSCEVQGALDLVAHVEGVGEARGVLGDARNHGDDVGLLVAELPHAQPRVRGHARLALDLARDDHHRQGVGPGSEDAVQGIDRART